MKLCKDCLHCQPAPCLAPFNYSLAKCDRSATLADFVTGEERHRFCEIERDNPNSCGPQAAYYVPHPAVA